jgi:hypothetical protein
MDGRAIDDKAFLGGEDRCWRDRLWPKAGEFSHDPSLDRFSMSQPFFSHSAKLKRISYGLNQRGFEDGIDFVWCA